MIVIDGSSLTVAEIARVGAEASVAPHGLQIAESARAAAAGSSAFAHRTALERPIYGRSTGVGANRNISLVAGDSGHTAVALLRSHATSAGPLRSPRRVRAMLLVRLNQLAAGGSGADPALLDAVVGLLESGALPPVREHGSIGTGDLSALAVTALTLQGELPVGSAPRFRFQISDALPFISSNAAAIADAALALAELRRLADAALVVAALTFVGVDGNGEAFSEAVEHVTPFAGAQRVCATFRPLVDGHAQPSRIQDPFGLRVLPQVHGVFFDALDALDRVVVLMANAPSENPVLSPSIGMAHHGGFHAAYLAQALDAVALAAAQSAQLSLARLKMLTEPTLTGLQAFLGDGTPGASGIMIVEYVAASAVAGLLATPASLQSVTLSRGVEEDASFASLAAVKVMQSVALYRTALAGELVAAVRAIRLKGGTLPDALSEVGSAVEVLSAEMEDRDLTADIAAAELLLDDVVRVVSSRGRDASE